MSGTETHKGLPVSGYRPQSPAAVNAVNGVKLIEEKLPRFLDDLAQEPELRVDPRWLSIGRTHLQQGFMAINRSVFKPQCLTDAEIDRIDS